MSKKTYRTYTLKSLDLHFNGGPTGSTEIVFRRGLQVDSTAKFTTSDERIQKLLESTKLFKRDYYLEKEVCDEAPKSAKAPEPVEEEQTPINLIIDTKTFRNIQEMRAAMAEYVPEKDLKGKKYFELLGICKAQGLDYKIIKDK